MNKIKYSLAIMGGGWGGLGFIRGINSYTYNYNKHESYLYSKSLFHGIFGLFIYIHPIILPYTIYKEVYRLEIDMRNIEDEKKTSFYNNLLW